MLSSSHLKITCHLHMWKGHYCYGIIYKLRLLQQKNIYINVKWCDLFHWCLYNKKIMEHYMATWRYKNLKFLCGKIFHSFVFQHSKGDFVFPGCHVLWGSTCVYYVYWSFHSFVMIVHIVPYCWSTGCTAAHLAGAHGNSYCLQSILRHGVVS